jgi:hypothetical protein
MKWKSKSVVVCAVIMYIVSSFVTTLGCYAESSESSRLIYEKTVRLDETNEISIVGAMQEDGSELWGALLSFSGEDLDREVVLTKLLSLVFLVNEIPWFTIASAREDDPFVLIFSNGQLSFVMVPDGFSERWSDESLWAEYRDDCFLIVNALSDLGRTSQVKNVLDTYIEEWINRMPTDTPVHDDEYVQLSYVGLEKDSLGRHVLAFKVVNKTNVTLTFQADTFALDGVSLGTITGSDNVAAQSTGTVRFTPREQIPSVAPSLLTGAIRVIDFSKTLWGKLSYVVNFVNIAITYD